MKIVKCDRCGKELNPFEINHAAVRVRGNYYIIADGLEFCGSCKKEAEAYFKECEAAFRTWLLNPEPEPEPEPDPEVPDEP